MSEWNEYKLGEVLISANTGLDAIKRAPIVSINTGIKCLRIQDVSQNKKYNNWGFTEVLENNFDKFKLIKNDIIVARTGATVGVNLIIKSNLNSVFNNGLIRLRVNDDFDSLYISYHLRSLEYWNHIDSIAFGTTSQPNIQINQLLDYRIKVPNLKSTQTAIAEILSSLDDKIELNNKINQELELLVQTLFKQWFIDFEFPNKSGEPYKSSGGEMLESELGEIPKGWNKIKLAKLVTKSHTGADASTRAPIVDYDTGVKCARVGDMTNNRSYHNWAFCKINPQDYARQKLGIGDIIVTRTATLGINQIIRENIDAVCNNGLIRLQIDKSICDPMFVYVQFQGDIFKEWINRISGDSSTRPNMQMDYLLDFNVILPEKELMNDYTESIKTYYDLIDENNRCNEELIKTRDTILPKLISGELEINEINN
jgi:type I restriction enzyme S subunit